MQARSQPVEPCATAPRPCDADPSGAPHPPPNAGQEPAARPARTRHAPQAPPAAAAWAGGCAQWVLPRQHSNLHHTHAHAARVQHPPPRVTQRRCIVWDTYASSPSLNAFMPSLSFCCWRDMVTTLGCNTHPRCRVAALPRWVSSVVCVSDSGRQCLGACVRVWLVLRPVSTSAPSSTQGLQRACVVSRVQHTTGGKRENVHEPGELGTASWLPASHCYHLHPRFAHPILQFFIQHSQVRFAHSSVEVVTSLG